MKIEQKYNMTPGPTGTIWSREIIQLYEEVKNMKAVLGLDINDTEKLLNKLSPLRGGMATNVIYDLTNNKVTIELLDSTFLEFKENFRFLTDRILPSGTNIYLNGLMTFTTTEEYAAKSLLTVHSLVNGSVETPELCNNPLGGFNLTNETLLIQGLVTRMENVFASEEMGVTDILKTSLLMSRYNEIKTLYLNLKEQVDINPEEYLNMDDIIQLDETLKGLIFDTKVEVTYDVVEQIVSIDRDYGNTFVLEITFEATQIEYDLTTIVLRFNDQDKIVPIEFLTPIYQTTVKVFILTDVLREAEFYSPTTALLYSRGEELLNLFEKDASYKKQLLDAEKKFSDYNSYKNFMLTLYESGINTTAFILIDLERQRTETTDTLNDLNVRLDTLINAVDVATTKYLELTNLDYSKGSKVVDEYDVLLSESDASLTTYNDLKTRSLNSIDNGSVTELDTYIETLTTLFTTGSNLRAGNLNMLNLANQSLTATLNRVDDEVAYSDTLPTDEDLEAVGGIDETNLNIILDSIFYINSTIEDKIGEVMELFPNDEVPTCFLSYPSLKTDKDYILQNYETPSTLTDWSDVNKTDMDVALTLVFTENDYGVSTLSSSEYLPSTDKTRIQEAYLTLSDSDSSLLNAWNEIIDVEPPLNPVKPDYTIGVGESSNELESTNLNAFFPNNVALQDAVKTNYIGMIYCDRTYVMFNIDGFVATFSMDGRETMTPITDLANCKAGISSENIPYQYPFTYNGVIYFNKPTGEVVDGVEQFEFRELILSTDTVLLGSNIFVRDPSFQNLLYIGETSRGLIVVKTSGEVWKYEETENLVGSWVDTDIIISIDEVDKFRSATFTSSGELFYSIDISIYNEEGNVIGSGYLAPSGFLTSDSIRNISDNLSSIETGNQMSYYIPLYDSYSGSGVMLNNSNPGITYPASVFCS